MVMASLERIKIPQKEIDRAHEEALEINKLVGEWRERDPSIPTGEAANKIIAERETSDLDKEVFAKGWGEKMLREIIASHPDVLRVEAAPKETDMHRKTDAFVEFKDGRKIGVQLTLVGFREIGENDLKTKLKEIIEQKATTYRGKEDIPITAVRGNYEEFMKAYDEWLTENRKGSPLDRFSESRKGLLSNEFLRMMGEVLRLKYNIKGNLKDKEWADYLLDLYSKRKENRKKKPAQTFTGQAYVSP
ncbi:MAG: hypothetical protein AAB904_00395 [Patescibacteria group bacterium]